MLSVGQMVWFLGGRNDIPGVVSLLTIVGGIIDLELESTALFAVLFGSKFQTEFHD